jgi:hypothetical protein
MIEVYGNDPDVEAFVIADHTTFRKYGPAPLAALRRSGHS